MGDDDGRDGVRDEERDDDPFAELDGDFDGDSVDMDSDELFDEMDVGDVDEEALWDALEDGEASGAVAQADSVAATDDAVEREGETAVVPKSRYCQSCEYFSAPPEVSCSHDGTEIVEHVDMESFRVRNCPIVAQRRGPTDQILTDDE
ncbi:hypothetical protein KY092_08475 [Natronomonas gomsonensis]|jgi:hypothetical protein|uniref:hypothetical protein n=1 Tax=Natronomonas gomsonensis TaxID=1046043 RepID=UPI0020CA5379|nr:hypothetical protein [Natronomonas gomsonensis]MCY4730593.1 hypothetical protein [Natronomonas gomsonensis]